MVFKICLLIIIWLIVAPVIGIFPSALMYKKKENYDLSWSALYIKGTMLMMFTFEFIEVPLTIKKVSVDVITGIWLSVLAAMLAVVVILRHEWISDSIKKIRERGLRPDFYKMTVAVFFIMQTIWLCISGADNYDDTVFAVIGADTYYTGHAFARNMYTGAERDFFLFNKYGVDSWYVLPAAIGRIVKLHSTVVLHIVLSVVMIIMSYMVYWKIAEQYFKKTGRYIFVLFVAVLNCCVIYNTTLSSCFYWNWPWQGKGIYGNIFIPLIWYYGILSMKEKNMPEHGGKFNWFWLFVTSVCAISVTSYSAQLTPVILLAILLYYTVENKRFINVMYYMIMALPSLAALIIMKIF